MTESVVVAIISGVVSSFSAILVFIASEKARKQKIADSHSQQLEETKNSINATLNQHRQEYLSQIGAVADSLKDMEDSITNMKAVYQQTVAVVDLKIEALEKAQNKHNNLIERTYKLEQDNVLQTEQIKVANHRIDDLEKKVN